MHLVTPQTHAAFPPKRSFSSMACSGHIIILFLLCTTARTLAQSTAPYAHAQIDLSSPTEPILNLSFHRDNTSTTSLVFCALNVLPPSARGARGRQATIDTLTSLPQHFAGWFVVQQESRELWLGASLQSGQHNADIRIALPNIVETGDSYPPIYTITIEPSRDLLRDLVGSSGPAATYAELKSVEFLLPPSAEVDDALSSRWTRRGPTRYQLDAVGLVGPAILTFEQMPNWISEWLRDKLAVFFLGFVVAVIIVYFVQHVSGIPDRFHRWIYAFLGALGLIVILVGFGYPFRIATIIFEGAGLVGFSLTMTMFLLLPHTIARRVSRFTKELQSGEMSEATVGQASKS